MSDKLLAVKDNGLSGLAIGRIEAADAKTMLDVPAVDDTLAVAGAAADAKASGDAIDELKTQLFDYNFVNLIAMYGDLSTKTTTSGFTLTWIDNENFTLVRSSGTGYGNFNLMNPADGMHGMKAGETYYVDYACDDSNVLFQIYDQNAQRIYANTDGDKFTIPAGVTGLLVRLRGNDNSATYNASGHLRLSTQPGTGKELLAEIEKRIYSKSITPYISDNTLTLADVLEDGFYVIGDSVTITDAPDGITVTALKVENYHTSHDGRFVKQIVSSVTNNTTPEYIRTSNYSKVFSAWKRLNTNINEYYQNVYQNTYNITATPTITTDTNNYLAQSENVYTDRTADILSMLQTNGVCHLGPGLFVTTGIVMPTGTMLIGCGASTEIRLANTVTDGAAITMDTQCTVKDLTLRGVSTTPTPSAIVGTRHGILWQGTYDKDQTSPRYGTIENVIICNFTGGGITCKNTGTPSTASLNVSDIFIHHCDAGINIAYFSEYHRFANVHSESNYYGCINNGGNNIFSCCDFSNNKLAFFMDNANGQSVNNTHGTAVGCAFNHADSNTGFGIKIVNCDNGFIFTGCQIFYGRVYIQDSDGIVFGSCNFGSTNCDITIDGGNTILFNGNMHRAEPTITITNNTKTHFNNCYVRDSGEEVTGQ